MSALTRWTLPAHYAGEVWPEYFVFLSQHRDSDALTRSNFTCALAAIGGESDTVRVVRERHWAVGWVEWIGIHEDDAGALEKARAIAATLKSYPVVNEDHFSQLEWDEAQQTWDVMPIADRVDLCREAGVSIFAARHAGTPCDDTGYILERLRG